MVFVSNILPSNRFHSWSLGQAKTGLVLLVVDILDPLHLNFVSFWLQQISICGALKTIIVGIARPDSLGNTISPQLARQIMSVIYKTFSPKHSNINLICSLCGTDLETAALIADRLVNESMDSSALYIPDVYDDCFAETLDSYVRLGEVFVELSDVLGRFAQYPPALQNQFMQIWRRERLAGRILLFKQSQIVCLAPVVLWTLVGDIERNFPQCSNGVISQSDLLRHLTVVQGLSHAQSLVLYAVMKALGMVVSLDADNQVFFPCLAESEPDRTALSALWSSTLQPSESYSERSFTFAFLPKGFFEQLAVKTFEFGFWKMRCCWRNGIVLETQPRGSGELGNVESLSAAADAASLVVQRPMIGRSRGPSYTPPRRRSQELDLDSIFRGSSSKDAAGEEALIGLSTESLQLFRMRITPGVQLFLEYCPEKYRLLVRVRGFSILQILFFILESFNTLIEDSWHIPSEIQVACPICTISEDPSALSYFDLHTLVATPEHSAVRCPRCSIDVSVQKLLPELYMDSPTSSMTEVLAYSQLENPVHFATGSNQTKIFKATLKNRTVAIKQIDISSTVAISLQSLAEIRREMWLMSILLHPNVLRLEGICRNETGHLLMVTEFADESDLQRFLKQEDRVIDRTTRIGFALQIASAMCYLHTRIPPICHRDLKSPNVLVKRRATEGFLLKVADFGMARLLGFAKSFVREKSADGLDNCLWQAPEIVRRGMIDHRADIYAFGIILWELLVQKTPFNEFQWMTDIADHIISGGRPVIPENPDCCPEYLELMQQCWSTKRSSRPEFAEIKDRIKKMSVSRVNTSASVPSSSLFAPPFRLS